MAQGSTETRSREARPAASQATAERKRLCTGLVEGVCRGEVVQQCDLAFGLARSRADPEKVLPAPSVRWRTHPKKGHGGDLPRLVERDPRTESVPTTGN